MSLLAANQARLEKALNKQYRYTEGIMTVKEQVDRYALGFTTMEESSVEFNRRKYNNMLADEQAEYQKKLDKKVTKYYATKRGEFLISLPKIVYEFYTTKGAQA